MTGSSASDLHAPPRGTDPRDQRAFRDLLGGYATGVAIVTGAGGGDPQAEGPWGMAVNSFSSVSLDPPLVGFCAARTSTTWPAIRAAGAFAVSILGEEHEAVSRLFARRGADRFGAPEVAGAWERAPSGAPVLRRALGWLDCGIEAVHPAGDHELVLGRARAMSAPAPGRPLLYYRGGYARIAP